MRGPASFCSRKSPLTRARLRDEAPKRLRRTSPIVRFSPSQCSSWKFKLEVQAGNISNRPPGLPLLLRSERPSKNVNETWSCNPSLRCQAVFWRARTQRRFARVQFNNTDNNQVRIQSAPASPLCAYALMSRPALLKRERRSRSASISCTGSAAPPVIPSIPCLKPRGALQA